MSRITEDLEVLHESDLWLYPSPAGAFSGGGAMGCHGGVPLRGRGWPKEAGPKRLGRPVMKAGRGIFDAGHP
jgi:hypothetical protein